MYDVMEIRVVFCVLDDLSLKFCDDVVRKIHDAPCVLIRKPARSFPLSGFF